MYKRQVYGPVKVEGVEIVGVIRIAGQKIAQDVVHIGPLYQVVLVLEPVVKSLAAHSGLVEYVLHRDCLELLGLVELQQRVRQYLVDVDRQVI